MSAPGDADPRGVRRHSPEVRAAIVSAYGSRSCRSVAQEHGISRNTVISMWRRARKDGMPVRPRSNSIQRVTELATALAASEADRAALERRVAKARAEALEEAAKIADADDGKARGGNMDYGPNVARRIAAAIRAITPGASS